MTAMAVGEGESAEIGGDGDAIAVRRTGWRLMRGLKSLSPAVVEAWNGLNEGALAVHNRFLELDVIARPNYTEPVMVWRIRRPPRDG